MRKLLVIAVGLLVLAQNVPAQDEAVESQISRVGLFKNGIGLMERTIEVSGDGTYYLAPSPEPIHGTIWQRYFLIWMRFTLYAVTLISVFIIISELDYLLGFF